MSKKDTEYMEAGRNKAWTHGVVNPPVYHASTVVFDSVAEMRAAGKAPHKIMSYGRRGTPTHFALCDALSELSGAAGAVLYSSGLAAVAGAILSFAKSGGRVLIADSVYEPTRAFADQVLKNYGVDVMYYDPCIGAGIAALLDGNTQVVVTESPGSVTMEVQDIPAIVAAARQVGAVVIMDNTWATPYFFNAFDHGVDVEVQALTKYVMGHSDGLLGSAAATAKHIDRLRQMSGALGHHGAPDDVARALKGLRTLPVRLKQHQDSARQIAPWLQGHDHVAEVRYPALPGSLGHDLWKRDFTGASGLLSLVMTEDNDAALTAFVEGMRHFKLGYSWGGYESLVMFYRHIGRFRTASGWNKGAVIRLHVGLEDIDDLKADLDAAFARYRSALRQA